MPFKFLQFLIISRLLRQKNGANISECLHVTSIMSNVILRFASWATGHIFGSSGSINSLKDQSEKTHMGCHQIQTTQCNSLSLILMRLCFAMLQLKWNKKYADLQRTVFLPFSYFPPQVEFSPIPAGVTSTLGEHSLARPTPR